MRWSLLVVLLLFVGTALAAGPRGRGPAEDPLEVAGLLVREGEWDRARTALAAVDPKARGFDATRFQTLRGLVALHDEDGTAAVAAFTAALSTAKEGRELLQLHLARADLLAGKPAAALQAIDAAGEVGAGLPGTWLLRAQAAEAAQDPDAAYAALRAGEARFPERSDLLRQEVFFLVRLGLYREARTRGERLLGRGDVGPDDAVAIAEALRQGHETSQALALLDAALLGHPDDRDLLVEAARVALDASAPRSAARYLERASLVDATLTIQAAEAWRRAGDVDAALRVNAQVSEPVAKARQRLGLLLDIEAWDQAMALEERCVRLGLGEDDNVAYGLAFAAYNLGDLDTAESWLRGIRDPDVFRRAGELRAAMAACEGGTCF